MDSVMMMKLDYILIDICIDFYDFISHWENDV